MTWQIKFKESAVKDLRKLDHDCRKLILQYLRKKLENNVNPKSAGKALGNSKAGLWRYRVGKYRVICKIEDAQMIILVVKIGKRDKVYN